MWIRAISLSAVLLRTGVLLRAGDACGGDPGSVDTALVLAVDMSGSLSDPPDGILYVSGRPSEAEALEVLGERLPQCPRLIWGGADSLVGKRRSREDNFGSCAGRPDGLLLTLMRARRGYHAPFKRVLAKGRLRTRCPVSVAMAFATAGGTPGRPGSPTPPMGAPLSTIATCTFGTSARERIL